MGMNRAGRAKHDPAAHQHIVTAFEEELRNLGRMMATMGDLTLQQVDRAVRSVLERNSDLARQVIAGDDAIDKLAHQVQEFTFRELALRQPTSIDLRTVIVALKVSTHLERIADYATNIAKRALQLNTLRPIEPTRSIGRMSALASKLVADVLQAYREQDMDKTLEVWSGDVEVDIQYTAHLRELLTYMMEDSRTITPCTHLLFIMRNLERIGDHAVNIAENVYFLITGKMPAAIRPKAETWEAAASSASDASSPRTP